MRIKELDPGPYEISLQDGSQPVSVGFAYFENTGPNLSESYFALVENVDFPIPYGKKVIFEPHEMPTVVDPATFYDWVLKFGNLGPNATYWEVEESYGPWDPTA